MFPNLEQTLITEPSNLTSTFNTDTYIVVVFAFISMLVLFLWFAAIGLKLYKYIPKEIAPNNLIFKIVPFVIFISYAVMLYFVTNMFEMMIEEMLQDSKSVEKILPYFFSFFGIILFNGICFLYIIAFTAKVIVSAERQAKAKFTDYIAEFFLIWLIPIGIWFLQPRINKIVDMKK